MVSTKQIAINKEKEKTKGEEKKLMESLWWIGWDHRFSAEATDYAMPILPLPFTRGNPVIPPSPPPPQSLDLVLLLLLILILND